MSRVTRVMVVDDDARVRRALERLIRRHRFEVSSFEAAVPALAQLDAIRPDAVISDFKMPGTNGLEFLRAVRERMPQVRLCLLTGYADLEAAPSAPGCEFTYLTKPWSDQLLVDQFLGER